MFSHTSFFRLFRISADFGLLPGRTPDLRWSVQGQSERLAVFQESRQSHIVDLPVLVNESGDTQEVNPNSQYAGSSKLDILRSFALSLHMIINNFNILT